MNVMNSFCQDIFESVCAPGRASSLMVSDRLRSLEACGLQQEEYAGCPCYPNRSESKASEIEALHS